MEKEIIAKVEQEKKQIVDRLATLVKIPSLTGEEGKAQKYVADQYRRMGLVVDVWEPDIEELFRKYPDVAQYPSHWEHDLIVPYHPLPTYQEFISSGKMDLLNYGDRPNVVGVWKGTGGGRSLLFNSHIDCVSVEPVKAWTHPPFGAEIVKGMMFGRGTSDNKGGIAAAMEAVRCLSELGIRVRGDVILESVVNEEHAGNGTLACLSRGYRADAAISGEPSQNKVRLGAYGGVYWGVNLTGRVLHTKGRWEGREQKGVSAIEKLPTVIKGLLDLEAVQNERPLSGFYKGKKPFALNIGRVWGGSYDTASAATCSLRGSIYFSREAGEVSEVMDLVTQSVICAAQGDPWLAQNPPEVLFYHHDDAYWVDPGEAIVGALSASAKTVTRQEPPLVAGMGANDCRHLVNKGRIPSAIFGPGGENQSHTIDESINIEDLILNVKILALTICAWCK